MKIADALRPQRQHVELVKTAWNSSIVSSTIGCFAAFTTHALLIAPPILWSCNRLGCLVQFSTCGIGSKNSSLLPSQCFSCCSLRAPSLKSRKYQATSLSGLEAVNSPCLSYFPNQVFPIKTGPYLPLTATCMSYTGTLRRACSSKYGLVRGS